MTTITDTAQIPSAATMTPETPEDVVRAIEEARSSGLRLAAVSTGHGLGALGDLTGSLLVDTSRLDSVEIDHDHRTARIGGSATWRQLLEAAARVGLVAPFGTSASVGVTGYSLGGGVGPLGRFLGLGCSAIRAADLVTMAGERIRVDASTDPELLWGLRGGGGGFGVVTALEIDLTPLPDMTGGTLVFPVNRAREVLSRWSEWTRRVPDELTSSARLVQPEPGEGLVLITIASPSPEIETITQIEDLLAMGPVANTIGTTNAPRFVAENGDPDGGPPVWYEHTMIDRLPEEAVEEAVEFADPAKGSPLMMSEFRHLGGALAKPSARGGALDQLDAEYTYFVLGPPEAKASLKHAADCLSDFGRGRSYFNFGLEGLDRTTVFDPETVNRLAALHQRLDPEGMMRRPCP